MKKLQYLVFMVAVVFACASCASIAEGAVSGALGSVGSSAAVAAAPAVTDLRSGETLVSPDSGGPEEATFYVAKILTPASPATKNQAEALYIEDGKKYWVNYVVDSRKAAKGDLIVGSNVLFLDGWADHDKIDADTYRKSGWRLGAITSTDELYKNRVEIAGQPYNINYLRVPLNPVNRF